MLRQSILILVALVALNVNANTDTENDPYSDYINLEIEKLELEEVLFEKTVETEVVSIASIEVYELEEELELGFNTKNYLPEGFDAYAGMNDIDWSTIELLELEEEVELGFNPKDYLPKGFNPYKGMECKGTAIVFSH